MMMVASFRVNILFIKREANRFPNPEMNEGVFPNLFKHSFTTASGVCTWGSKKPNFPGLELMKLGVAVAPAVHANTSTWCLRHSYQRLSPNIRLKALVAA